MIFTVPDGFTAKGTPRSSVVLLLQHGKAHSKYYDLTCFCNRKRKDGSCKHLDVIFEANIRPAARGRVRVTQPLVP